MIIEDKYLNVENCNSGDIITFIDEGAYSTIKDRQGREKRVVNFTVDNGTYRLIYTPGNTALKELMKQLGRETKSWIGKKFQVKITDMLVGSNKVKVIFPEVIKS